MKFLFSVFIFSITYVSLNVHTAHAGSIVPICPPQYVDLSPAPVNSNLYKGHCGLYICTNGGTQGLNQCKTLQIQADALRKSLGCTYVPPYYQCKR